MPDQPHPHHASGPGSQPHPALLHLRAHHTGTLLADDVAHRIRFVIDPATGALVIPCGQQSADAGQLVLFVPEESPEVGPELQLLLEPEPIDPDSEAADRWKVYHGLPRQTRWARMTIGAARFRGEVIEADALAVPSRLRAAEPGLCKWLNRDPAALARMCSRQLKVQPEQPVAVGVDELGLDVRARLGILRLPFEHPVLDSDAARARLEAMVGTAS